MTLSSLTLRVVEAHVEATRDELTVATHNVGLLLRERTLSRHVFVDVMITRNSHGDDIGDIDDTAHGRHVGHRRCKATLRWGSSEIRCSSKEERSAASGRRHGARRNWCAMTIGRRYGLARMYILRQTADHTANA